MKEKQQLPDAQKHQIISFVKSAIRIIGVRRYNRRISINKKTINYEIILF